jgi:hypothetical protein
MMLAAVLAEHEAAQRQQPFEQIESLADRFDGRSSPAVPGAMKLRDLGFEAVDELQVQAIEPGGVIFVAVVGRGNGLRRAKAPGRSSHGSCSFGDIIEMGIPPCRFKRSRKIFFAGAMRRNSFNKIKRQARDGAAFTNPITS